MFFRKYRLRKIWLDKYLKSRVSEYPETDDTANWSKHCSDRNHGTFTIFINHCQGSCIGKKCLLVIHKILTLFFNTLTVDDKHFLLNRDNLLERIHMQLSKKQKTFCEISFAFLESILNFRYFPTKDDPHSWCISRNTSSQKYG